MQHVKQHGNAKINPVIAGALLDAGLNQTQVANHLQVNRSSISRFAEKYKDNKEFVPQTQVFIDNLHHIIAESMAEGLTCKLRGLRYFNGLPDDSYTALPDSTKVATMNSGNISWGVDYDKHRLQTGQSTINLDLHAEYQALRQLQDAKQALTLACQSNDNKELQTSA